MRFLLAGLILAISLAAARAEEPVCRIAFGSCYKPEKPAPIWAAIAAFDPQVWLWLGDNVYVDWVNGKYVKLNQDPRAFEVAYEKLAKGESVPVLARLPSGHVMATWDDHDYGLNDAGKEWSRKREAREAFAGFFGGPDRTDGVYSSRDFGPDKKRIRVILLDTRYNRDNPGPEGDILGESQWRWLKEELRRPGADVVVIGSSIQILPEQHRFEKWGNFPKAKRRLFQAIRETGVAGVIFLSGDRHHAEISKLMEGPAGYPLYEVTSSGLTEGGGVRGEENRLRVGEVFHGNNYGSICLDWVAAQPRARLEIRDGEGRVVREVSFPLSQLAPPKG